MWKNIGLLTAAFFIITLALVWATIRWPGHDNTFLIVSNMILVSVTGMYVVLTHGLLKTTRAREEASKRQDQRQFEWICQRLIDTVEKLLTCDQNLDCVVRVGIWQEQAISDLHTLASRMETGTVSVGELVSDLQWLTKTYQDIRTLSPGLPNRATSLWNRHAQEWRTRLSRVKSALHDIASAKVVN